MISYDRSIALVQTFVEAINERDLEKFLSTLSPEVELHTRRGVKHGHTGAAEWFDHQYENVELEMVPGQLVAGAGWVVGSGTMLLRWRGEDEIADSTEQWARWEIGPGGISRWSPLPDASSALREIDLAFTR
jgi:hypothetical protein